MREIMVAYVLDDEHERRLKEIASEYKKRVVKDACDDMTEDKIFEHIMRMGSKYDIERKFSYWEKEFGLGELNKDL